MQLFLKRAFDIAVAGLLLVLLSPLLLILALLVRLRLGAPVLFRQRRLGFIARPFDLIKFRTMTDARDGSGNLLPDAERLTPFGLWLRATSLDELPELWNILTGKMSLVGPRPLLPEYLPFYSGLEATRHAMRPGVTGLAQVSGRNALSWDERLKLDAHYVAHFSLALDIAILWRTVMTVLRKHGINADGHATMERLDDQRRRAQEKQTL